MLFGMVCRVSRGMGVLDGVQVPKRKEQCGFFVPVGLNGQNRGAENAGLDFGGQNSNGGNAVLLGSPGWNWGG